MNPYSRAAIVGCNAKKTLIKRAVRTAAAGLRLNKRYEPSYYVSHSQLSTF
jgi:hypothetical protein